MCDQAQARCVNREQRLQQELCLLESSGCPKSPGASCSAFGENISRDLLGGLSNSNQILCCFTMPTSICALECSLP